MKLARQLLSKAISQASFDKSPSNYLKALILDFAKSIGSINSSCLKKTDTGNRLKRYEKFFQKYYDDQLIRSLCAGKDSSLAPVIEIENSIYKQIPSPVSALPERFNFKIIEPELDEVSRNTFQDEADVKYATYEFCNIVHFSGDHESSQRVLNNILARNFSENDNVRLNFISSLRISNQYIVDFKVNDLKLIIEEKSDAFKKFIERYSFDIAGIRKVCKPKFQKNVDSNKIFPRAVVIFIDSLDKRIFEDDSIMSELPHFKKIFNSSDFFENFVSSADWTYPVMHSIFYGISPSISFSIFRTYTPNSYSNSHENKFSDASSFITYIQSKEPKIYSRVNSENHLFSKLKRENIETYSIRQSSNLSWLYSLTSQGSITLEKNINAAQGLQKIIEKDDINDNLLWIDLDDLHKLDMPLSNTSVDRSENNYLFTIPSSSNDRLYSKTNESDQNIYVQKVKALDKKIGEVINLIDDNVPIVIFSDHGSKAFSSEHDSKSGTLSPSRILNPTLLVSNSRNDYKRTFSSIIESQDIHQLLLNLCNVKCIVHSAIDFEEPELYSYYGYTNSTTPSYQEFVNSLNSRRFATTMGSNITHGEMSLECILTSLQAKKKKSLKASIPFTKLMKLVAKSNMTDLEISYSFYKHWTSNGVKALIKAALSNTKEIGQ